MTNIQRIKKEIAREKRAKFFLRANPMFIAVCSVMFAYLILKTIINIIKICS